MQTIDHLIDHTENTVTYQNLTDFHRKVHFCDLPLEEVRRTVLRFAKDKSIPEKIRPNEFFTLHAEVTKRCNFLNKFKWDYLALDFTGRGIPPKYIHLLFKTVLGPKYTEREKDEFLRRRPIPESPICFLEIAAWFTDKRYRPPPPPLEKE